MEATSYLANKSLQLISKQIAETIDSALAQRAAGLAARKSFLLFFFKCWQLWKFYMGQCWFANCWLFVDDVALRAANAILTVLCLLFSQYFFSFLSCHFGL